MVITISGNTVDGADRLIMHRNLSTGTVFATTLTSKRTIERIESTLLRKKNHQSAEKSGVTQ